MTKHNENRQSFRITESVLLQYEVIDEAEFEKGLKRWKVQRGGASGTRSKVLDLDARLDELLFSIKNNEPTICDAIKLLNEKLDFVLESLPEFKQTKDALASQPAQTCELSAEGMVFGSTELLPPRTKLLLRFLLISDNRFFETFAAVVRAVDVDDADSQSYRIAVAFHDMKTAERELLFQHLFSKQSETLRLQRKQAETTD